MHPHMKPHCDTVKKYPHHTDNTQHNKLVLAKVGHTTKTLILAKVGLAKLGGKKSWPKSVWPKSAMTYVNARRFV